MMRSLARLTFIAVLLLSSNLAFSESEKKEGFYSFSSGWSGLHGFGGVDGGRGTLIVSPLAVSVEGFAGERIKKTSWFFVVGCSVAIHATESFSPSFSLSIPIGFLFKVSNWYSFGFFARVNAIVHNDAIYAFFSLVDVYNKFRIFDPFYISVDMALYGGVRVALGLSTQWLTVVNVNIGINL